MHIERGPSPQEKEITRPEDQPGSLEIQEGTDVEKGDSFFQRTAAKLKEGVKTFFSVPEEGKIINIMEKVGGTAYMAFMTKVAMDQRFNELVATSSEREKLALAALFLGIAGVVPIMDALAKQYREKERKKINKDKGIKHNANNN